MRRNEVVEYKISAEILKNLNIVGDFFVKPLTNRDELLLTNNIILK
jgi:hypothetical protein